MIAHFAPFVQRSPAVILDKSHAARYIGYGIHRFRSCDSRSYPGKEEQDMTKALISVTGLDATGIIARVATKLSEMNINILDITQTILGGYFTMMMVVDLDGAHMEFAAIDEALQPVRDEMKMSIHMQRMDIFDAMHRI